MKGLNDKQKKEVFQLAKQAKNQGKTLCEVFETISKKYGLAPGSVRNFYYKSVAENKAFGLKAKKLEHFSKQEESELIAKIIAERKNTGSLRSAILNVANGDKTLALRYQNKFANLLKKQRSVIMREVILQREKYGKTFNPYFFKEKKDKKVKLKREIDELVYKINQKCSSESAMLRKKIIEYEKLQDVTHENQNLSSFVLDYFGKIRCDKAKKSN